METVTLTGEDVVALPAASRARAVSVCVPFGRRGRGPGHGIGRAGVLGGKIDAVEEEAHARNADVVARVGGHGRLPVTVAPGLGAVSETVGGVVSVGVDWVVADALADWADSLPAASYALTV